MRVITGKYKGRTLVAPKGNTRPTLDRTKETLFNIIAPKISGAGVLDLFAGSGQIAIECLSRGASRAVLCDNSREAVSAIKSNFEKLGLTPEIYFGNYSDCLRSLSTEFDLIFLDPPYGSGYYEPALRIIDERGLLAKCGTVICEHSAEVNLTNAERLEIYDTRKIGSVKFSFYRRSDDVCE